MKLSSFHIKMFYEDLFQHALSKKLSRLNCIKQKFWLKLGMIQLLFSTKIQSFLSPIPPISIYISVSLYIDNIFTETEFYKKIKKYRNIKSRGGKWYEQKTKSKQRYLKKTLLIIFAEVIDMIITFLIFLYYISYFPSSHKNSF